MKKTLFAVLVKSSLFAVTLSAVATVVVAQENHKGFSVSPMAGIVVPDSERDLDDGTFYSVGIGYDFGGLWGVELTQLKGDLDPNGSGPDVDLDLFRLDALFYLDQGRLAPYLVAGIGDGEFSPINGETADDSFANLGLGFKYAVSERFAFRGDARLMQGLDDSQTDYLAGVGFTFNFGESSSSYTPVTKAPKDSDNDGVYDSQDDCPGTAAGVEVDAMGCEVVKDSDSDGVVDSIDECPDTEAGAKVNAVGCYEALTESVSVQLSVKFATNSANVVSTSLAEIEKVADFLRSYPQATATIEGHTDSDGSAAYNKDLSQRRADAVRQLFIDEHGVDPDRLIAIGYGEEQPIASNATAAGKAENRRVTAVVNATATTGVD